MRKIILILLVMVCIPSFAEIAIPLKAQAWLQTKTAKVTVNVSASSKNNDVMDVQQKILNKLDQLAKAKWHVVAMNRSEGRSGLTNLNWQVTARVPLNQVSSVAKKIKGVSESGMQFNLGRTDYSLSFADYQKGQAMLRQQIYQLAKQVAKEANETFPGEKYKIDKIKFGEKKVNRSILRPQMLVKMQEAPVIPVGRQMTMEATVYLES